MLSFAELAALSGLGVPAEMLLSVYERHDSDPSDRQGWEEGSDAETTALRCRHCGGNRHQSLLDCPLLQALMAIELPSVSTVDPSQQLQQQQVEGEQRQQQQEQYGGQQQQQQQPRQGRSRTAQEGQRSAGPLAKQPALAAPDRAPPAPWLDMLAPATLDMMEAMKVRKG